MNKKILLLIFVIIGIFNSYAYERDDERIMKFHSDIVIDTTGRIFISEKIKFNVTGESINRGIVRTLPRYRKNVNGKKVRIDFNVLSILRNNHIEPYSTAIENGDLAIYIGDKNKSLEYGIHEYTIVYDSRGHIGFFDDYDEIYWNITGNDWAFDIDSVSATVFLPSGAKVINNACYTGIAGSTKQEYNYTTIGDSVVQYSSVYNLYQGEGMTIATSFTPNIIKRPPPPSKAEIFWQQYGLLITYGCGILFFLIILIIIRKKTSLGLSKPTVIPRFTSPENLSPALLRYINKQNINEKAITASILSMAVKKAIRIKEDKKAFILEKISKTVDLSTEEINLFNKLFAIRDSFSIAKKYNSRWSNMYYTFKENIKRLIDITTYFPERTKYTSIMCLSYIGLVTLCALISYLTDLISTAEIVILVSIGIFSIIFWSAIYSSRKNWIGIILLLFFFSPLYAGNFFGFKNGELPMKYTFIFINLMCLIYAIYLFFVKIKTAKGLQMKADLEGFKMYIETAEIDRLNFLTPPDNTPEQFEKILPYAVALDLEVKWEKKFSNILKEMDYRPDWYAGNRSFTARSFTRSLSSSMTSTAKSGATQPSSSSSSSGSRSWSSGSSGGGRSGGGGGGGGGRGW